MSKWVFTTCVLVFAGVSSAQVIFYPPIVREFVDHPFDPRLDSSAVARLASLQEPGGAEWSVDAVYFNETTGERIWPVDSDFDERFGDRVRLSSQPLYFRKGDLLPPDDEGDAEPYDPEMSDVRDRGEEPAHTSNPTTRPASAERADEPQRGTIVIIPFDRQASRTSDNGDRVTD